MSRMNPVEIERQLETLKESLANWASPRLKLLTICDFVAEFQHSMSLLQSYLIEFIDGLAGLLKTSSLVGIDPARLLPLVDGLEYVQANLPSSFESTAISEVITILREQIASLYLSVGEIDAAALSLQAQWQKIPADFCRHDAQQDVPAMESTIHERILRIDSQYDEIKGKLHNLAKHTPQSPGLNAVCSYFPVIERPAGHPTDMAEEGALRRICISILGFANGDEDELIFEFQAVQNGDDARKQFSEPLAAARVLLAKNFPRLRNRYFIFRITLDNPSYLHDGNSASLASAALFYTAILNFVNLHISYSIPANVAMSGGIGPDGCILPVSEATLDKKIAAGFFSPVRYLAIPESQKAKSERLLERYKDIYPQKDFSIVACERLDDVFYDRRLTQDRRVSAPVYLARQAWRHRSPIGITAIFALLLTILAFMLYGPLDKNP
ncbi:MAG: hypothetical protein ACE5I1_20990, partial [bacterium]